ncbi:MAG: hypothetical protein ABSG51_07440 [Terracidiphilus sp.]|jgi:hypothetical protein
MLPPEVIALRVWILRACKSNVQYILHDGAVLEGGKTQLSPILPLASIDNIIDGRQDISHTVIQMPMQHSSTLPKYSVAQLNGHKKHITSKPRTAPEARLEQSAGESIILT